MIDEIDIDSFPIGSGREWSPEKLEAIKNSIKEYRKDHKPKVRAKQKRTTEFKLRAYTLYIGGMSAKEAFLQACEEHGTTPSGCMTNYSTSYMWDYKVELTKLGLINEQKS